MRLVPYGPQKNSCSQRSQQCQNQRALRMRLVPSRLARRLARSLCSWRTMRTAFCGKD